MIDFSCLFEFFHFACTMGNLEIFWFISVRVTQIFFTSGLSLRGDSALSNKLNELESMCFEDFNNILDFCKFRSSTVCDSSSVSSDFTNNLSSGIFESTLLTGMIKDVRSSLKFPLRNCSTFYRRIFRETSSFFTLATLFLFSCYY